VTTGRPEAGPGTAPAPSEQASLEGRVRRGAAWGVVNNLAMRAANIAVMVVVVRLVAPAELGVFAVALAVSVVLSGFADWGVSAYLVRGDTDVERAGPTVALVAIASGLVLAAGTALAAPGLAAAFGTPDAVGPIRVMSLCLVVGGFIAVPTALLTRDFRQDRLFAATAAGFVPSSVLLVALAAADQGAMAFAWSRVAALVVQGLVVVWTVRRWFTPRLDLAVLRPVLTFGLPLAGANLVNYVLVNADYLVVGRQLGPVLLGLYFLAFNISSWSTAVLSAAINGVAMPAFSRVSGDPDRLAAALDRATRGVGVVALPVAGLTLALAEPLVLTLYGDGWAPAVPVLRVLAVYGGAFVLVSLLSNLLVGAGRSGATLVIQLAWIASLAPAMLVGARLSGVDGVAWAHVLAIVLVVLPLYLRAVRDLVPDAGRVVLRAVAPTLLAVAGAGLVAFVVAAVPDPPLLRLLLGGLAGGSVYLVLVGREVARLLGRAGPVRLRRHRKVPA
jgi:lipopolysaccharide exporter